jgi:hypothetical protein
VTKLQERNHSENTGEEWRLTLKFIMKKWDRRVLTGFRWLRIEDSGWRLQII